MVDIRQVIMPPDMTVSEVRMAVVFRLQDNLEATKHPLHHLTANGAIVDPDPTLEYLLSRLPESEQKELLAKWRPSPNAPKAIPVNRKFYGVDPYERH